MNATRVEEHLNTEFNCHLLWENGRMRVASGQIVRHMKSDHSDNAFFILCPAKGVLADDYGPFPVSVALHCRNCHKGVTLKVRTIDQTRRKISFQTLGYCATSTLQIYGRRLLQKLRSNLQRDKLAVCVRPSFGPASDAKQLAQVILMPHPKKKISVMLIIYSFLSS
jgi:hypothetical protein